MNVPDVLVKIRFFFNDTATTEIYTLSLHDALPISVDFISASGITTEWFLAPPSAWTDRKSTRLNSSHLVSSYAVFCLKKKKEVVVAEQDIRPSAELPTHPGKFESRELEGSAVLGAAGADRRLVED